MARSYLYAPGSRKDLMVKALASEADAVVFDLEDAVSAGSKDIARENVASLLRERSISDVKEVFIRLNSGKMALEDLEALSTVQLTGFRIAKAEDPNLIGQISAVLDSWRRIDQASERISLQLLIESVSGLMSLDQMVTASARVHRTVFGAGDFLNDIVARSTPDRIASLYVRSQLVVLSRHLGLSAPIAHVYTPIGDLEGLLIACKEDAALGFHGRSCIHPKQIPIIHECFGYSQREKLEARAIIDAYNRQAAHNVGAFVMADGTFVDEAIYKRACRIIEAQ